MAVQPPLAAIHGLHCVAPLWVTSFRCMSHPSWLGRYIGVDESVCLPVGVRSPTLAHRERWVGHGIWNQYLLYLPEQAHSMGKAMGGESGRGALCLVNQRKAEQQKGWDYHNASKPSISLGPSSGVCASHHHQSANLLAGFCLTPHTCRRKVHDSLCYARTQGVRIWIWRGYI